VRVALEALEERVAASRWTPEDPFVYGIADPDLIRRSLERDESAAEILRAAVHLRPGTLDHGTPG
jgi:hypothetical protein